MQQPTKTYTVKEAELALKRYCAYRERCHKEVDDKLRNMKMIPEARDQIIYKLLQENYLNEERFARSFARGKFRIKKWGRRRIIQELKYRNINKTIINLALTEISDSDYFASLDDLAKKRLSQITERNPLKRKKKLADYLLYRGWESHLVYEKLHQLIK